MINSCDFFKCLSDQTRLYSILLILKEGELCVCELVEALGVSQPKVSRHLAQLRAYGLLKDQRKEQWVYYSLNSELDDWVNNILDTTYKANKAIIKPYRVKLKSMENRPCNK